MDGTENLFLTARRFYRADSDWTVASGQWQQTAGSSQRSVGSVGLYDYVGSGNYTHDVITGTHWENGLSLDVQSAQVTGTYGVKRWTRMGSGIDLHVERSAYGYSGSGTKTEGLITGTLTEDGWNRGWDLKLKNYKLIGDRWQVRGNGAGGNSGFWHVGFSGSGAFVGIEPGVVGTATLKYGHQFGFGRSQVWALGRDGGWIRTGGSGSGAGEGFYRYDGSGAYSRPFQGSTLYGVAEESVRDHWGYDFGEMYRITDGGWVTSGSGHADGTYDNSSRYSGSGAVSWSHAGPDYTEQYTSEMEEAGGRGFSSQFTLDWDYAPGRPVNWTWNEGATASQSATYTYYHDLSNASWQVIGDYAGGNGNYYSTYCHPTLFLTETSRASSQRTQFAQSSGGLLSGWSEATGEATGVLVRQRVGRRRWAIRQQHHPLPVRRGGPAGRRVGQLLLK